MSEMIFEDLRRILLGLLFVIAFGWMAAQVVPGADGTLPQQIALAAEDVPAVAQGKSGEGL